MSRLFFLFLVLFSLSTNSHAVEGGVLLELQKSNFFNGLAPELKTLLSLSLLSFIPIFLIAMTAFTRIVIVLSMLRHALGLQQTPPNIIIITLSIFLTFYTMLPVWQKIEQESIRPFIKESISIDKAIAVGSTHLKTFMVNQTREEDFIAIIDIAKISTPKSIDEISFSYLIPAFLLSELTTAFKIAFVIFIPFLLIDLVVASILMSLGMIMLPPISIALPIKVMLFVLIDGWALVSYSLVSSFN